jgi:hypothetical protein
MGVRRISSLMTFYFKFLLLPLYLLGIINFLFVFGPSDPLFDTRNIIFIVLYSAAFLGFYAWLGWPLKRVLLDDINKCLYISNYRKEITIPLSQIADVKDFVFSDPRRVTIYLRKPEIRTQMTSPLHAGEFGNKIVFLVTYRFFGGWSTHPIVDELRQLSLTARN